MDPRQVQGMGMGRVNRAVRRAVPDAEGAPPRVDRADAVHRQAGRAGRSRRSHIGAEERTVAGLQRLFDRRRRHGAARLRQLRTARGLRTTRSPGHFRTRGDCHRALRAIVARHQTEGRGRARRGRLSDLFRSQGRRVCGRRRLPAWSDASGRRCAARQRDGHAGRARRPLDARCGRHAERPAARAQ